MAGKKKRNSKRLVRRQMPSASERPRNRSSPQPVVNLYEHLNNDQKSAIVDMELDSMLDIKCETLHNPVINWLAPLYDKHSRVFVIPGRGRIPLNAESVHHTLGLPRGQIRVVYAVHSETESHIAPLIFPGRSSTPKITEVFTILKNMELADDIFKKIWLLYLVCTLLAPTTCNKISNRCYPILDKIEDVKNMDFCQFVCDKLHDELSRGRLSGACLFQLQLLYVDSLNISSLDVELAEGRFVVNKWTKKDVETVLNADLKMDGSGYGNLQLKPHLAANLSFFGGADAFDQWIGTNTAANCPKKRKEKVSRLIGDFTSGMTVLLAGLVQGWTSLDDIEESDMEKSFAELSKYAVVDESLNDVQQTNSEVPIMVSAHPSSSRGHAARSPAPPATAAAMPNIVPDATMRSVFGVGAVGLDDSLSPQPKSVSVSDGKCHISSTTRITRSVTKAASAGKSTDELHNKTPPELRGVSSMDVNSASSGDSDFDANDDDIRYFISTRERVIRDSKSVFTQNIDLEKSNVGTTGCLEAMINNSVEEHQAIDGLVDTNYNGGMEKEASICSGLVKPAEAASVHQGVTCSDTDVDKEKHAPILENRSDSQAIRSGVPVISGETCRGYPCINDPKPTELVDKAQISAVSVSKEATLVDGTIGPVSCVACNSGAMPGSEDFGLKQANRRRLRSINEAKRARELAGADVALESAVGVETNVVSPPRKQRKLVANSGEFCVTKPVTRSSPRLISKQHSSIVVSKVASKANPNCVEPFGKQGRSRCNAETMVVDSSETNIPLSDAPFPANADVNELLNDEKRNPLLADTNSVKLTSSLSCRSCVVSALPPTGTVGEPCSIGVVDIGNDVHHVVSDVSCMLGDGSKKVHLPAGISADARELVDSTRDVTDTAVNANTNVAPDSGLQGNLKIYGPEPLNVVCDHYDVMTSSVLAPQPVSWALPTGREPAPGVTNNVPQMNKRGRKRKIG